MSSRTKNAHLRDVIAFIGNDITQDATHFTSWSGESVGGVVLRVVRLVMGMIGGDVVLVVLTVVLVVVLAVVLVVVFV